MNNQSFCTELIERYLRAGGRRYFRGHHDGEYFFILSAGHERLHVHLEVPPADKESVTIRVTPANFYPAVDRARLRTIADKWNVRDRRTRAVVYESCDQTRIGVVAEKSYPLAPSMPFEEFAGLADDTIKSAVKLFAEMTRGVEQTPARRLGTWLRDAG
jgi:hypothetical protein